MYMWHKLAGKRSAKAVQTERFINDQKKKNMMDAGQRNEKQENILTEFNQNVWVVLDGCFEIGLCQYEHSILNFDLWFITMHQAGKGNEARNKCNEQHFLLYSKSTIPKTKLQIDDLVWYVVVVYE